jgi:surface polysaccharide O-acyltransferase-like enzyme
MAALWWFVVWSGGKSPLPVEGPDVVATFLGFAPWIGTSWFVTLIVQLVLFFPLLRRVVDGSPAWLSLLAAALLSSWCVWHTWTVVAWGREIFGDNVAEPGWYYLWIFVPRVLVHVVAGMLLGRVFGGRPSLRVTGLALALAATGPFLLAALDTLPDAAYVGPLRAQVVVYLLDVPLTVGLLGLLQHLPLPRLLGEPLSLAGRWSWGLYLGHLWVHEALHLGGIEFELSSQRIRAQYALILLILGALVAILGALLRSAGLRGLSWLGKVLASPAARS